MLFLLLYPYFSKNTYVRVVIRRDANGDVNDLNIPKSFYTKKEILER